MKKSLAFPLFASVFALSGGMFKLRNTPSKAKEPKRKFSGAELKALRSFSADRNGRKAKKSFLKTLHKEAAMREAA